MISLADLYSGDHDKLKQYPGEYVMGYNKRMRMNVDRKLEDAQKRFTELKSALTKLEEEITILTNKKTEVFNEVLRIQGEYRALQSLKSETNGETEEKKAEILELSKT